MKTIFAFFASLRYWNDENELNESYAELKNIAKENESFLITDKNVPKLPSADCIVLVPMSGAMQKTILDTVNPYESALLYGAYIKGNASKTVCSLMLEKNAAPAFMDTWAVLHRKSGKVMLALNERELCDKLNVFHAYFHVKNTRLIKIGNTEPWVVSNASREEIYSDKFGIEIIHVGQDEVAEIYRKATDKDGQKYYDHFVSNSCGCREPNENDLRNAARMAYALMAVMEKYKAKAAAIACFDLLKTGTNACLGVSYINDCTDSIIACECDMDSAITMLLMKKLTEQKLWMANPGLQADGRVNFSHCTSPFCIDGKNNNRFILRNHHESGIGVSLQVEMPQDIIVTACRVSDDCRKMTINSGVSKRGEYENACRTQMYVEFENYNKYLETALGCHQVFAFEDIGDKLKMLAELFDVQVL